MTLTYLIVLALIQGITEFLPISSSAHLVLAPWFLEVADQGPVIDVAAHVGTLVAVMLYFRADVATMTMGALRLTGGNWDRGADLAAKVIVGSIPVIVAGYVVSEVVYRDNPEWLRSPAVIGWATLGFGIVLWFADRFFLSMRRIDHLTYVDAVVIGLAQALALIPGTSRSGITMTAARMLGFERGEAARFSLLLSIPAIAAGGTKATLDVVEAGDLALGVDALAVAGLSCAAALAAIHLMLRWLERSSFAPFVAYRVALGLALLYAVYG